MLDWSELSNWNEYTKLLIALLAMEPIPVIVPLFLGILGNRSMNEKKKIALYGIVAFVVTMIVFTFFGGIILNMFGITIHAFRIAGGLLLLLMALEMMRSAPPDADSDDVVDSSASAIAVGLVPLAIPILAGPGAISTIIIIASEHDSFSHRLLVTAAILAVAVVVYFALRLALSSERLFTPTTAVIFNRIMGLIIAAIAIEFMLDGIAGHFPNLEIVH